MHALYLCNHPAFAEHLLAIEAGRIPCRGATLEISVPACWIYLWLGTLAGTILTLGCLVSWLS